ncbi:hypothetical protein CCHR01_10163 [Colletotrichum chrysophilum]|uniref:Uncharacterized protein n=1 Tax=Colletotrichum chrysophilum TaxID=1836956 RepID=A0AAD9AFF6_9PEZI|nr:hypothetical protein CCHR01_10163 [Colletotrichum chrysophilum]
MRMRQEDEAEVQRPMLTVHGPGMGTYINWSADSAQHRRDATAQECAPYSVRDEDTDNTRRFGLICGQQHQVASGGALHPLGYKPRMRPSAHSDGHLKISVSRRACLPNLREGPDSKRERRESERERERREERSDQVGRKGKGKRRRQDEGRERGGRRSVEGFNATEANAETDERHRRRKPVRRASQSTNQPAREKTTTKERD